MSFDLPDIAMQATGTVSSTEAVWNPDDDDEDDTATDDTDDEEEE